MLDLLAAFLVILGIALQLGSIFGGLNDKEKIGAFVAGFFLEGVAGSLFFFMD